MTLIVYRYLNEVKYAVEALRTCSFKVSSPAKYWGLEGCRLGLEDDAECRPKIVTSNECGPLFLSAEHKKTFTQAFNETYSRRSTIADVVRILCLSNPEWDPSADFHMWRKYGGDFSGVRIGIRLDVDNDLISKSDNFRGERVSYCVNPNVVDVDKALVVDDISEQCFNICFRKSKNFKIESEYRLMTRVGKWRTYGGGDYLLLKNEMIASVSVGIRARKEEVSQLLKVCKKNYDIGEILFAQPDDGSVAYVRTVDGCKRMA